MRMPRHSGVLLLCACLLGVTTTGVIYSPTLYQLFCAATGYNGTVRRAATVTPVKEAHPDKAQKFTVLFDANTGGGLNWEFKPEQPQVVVEVGKPTTIYYDAKNLSDKPVVGRAVFNVTPFQVAPYFFKIQCFCFTDERLGPGESARMPVVFYLDQDMLEDKEAMALRRVTLSYTFYPQDYDPAQVAEARDLKKGSDDTSAAIARGDPVQFDNDAPRD